MMILQAITFLIRLFKIILATCGFNLIVMVIIIGLLNFFDQGAPLIVELLASPGNVFLFWFIILGTALAYGHYPVYSYKWKTTRNIFRDSTSSGGTTWMMNSPQWGGFGIITYQDEYLDYTKTSFENSSQIKVNKAFHSFRGLLGLTFILAIFYCLVFSYQKFIGSDDHTLWFTGVIIVLCGLYFIIDLPESWIEPAIVGSIGLFLIVTAVNIYLTFQESIWTPGIFWTFSIALALLALFYILFKHYRSTMDKSRFMLADHVNYLILISGLGWISFFTVMVSQFYPDMFNPIVILLAYFNVVYGLYVLTLKHRLYYFYKSTTKIDSQKEEKHPLTSLFFRMVTPLILIFIAIWIVLSGIVGNNLHQLNLVSNPNPKTITEFKSDFGVKMDLKDPLHHDTIYFIASYGGGLKANAWNMMVMDTLDKLDILENTVAISGVSGGNIGQFLYGGLDRSSLGLTDKRKKIKEISTHNFLSMDLAWLLGWDFIRELDIFSKNFKPDRSRQSLQVYQNFIGDNKMTTVGMQTFWNGIYDKKGHYPILISNSAGVNNRRGIAISVSFTENGITFEKTFPGAVNLLRYEDHPGYSLSYMGAASTSNRFPFLSPAAKVPSKGHYVDGGYFENSGMFSLLNFYEALEKDTSWSDIFQDRTIVFLQIANHKSTYIRQMVPDSLIQPEKITDAGEILQVLQTKASTEFLPYYFEQKVWLNDAIVVSRINIPYKFTIDDIKKQFYIRSLKPAAEQRIQDIIDRNDQFIDSMYQEAGLTPWEAIEPATARLLSIPAVNYMNMIIKHDPRINARMTQGK